MENIEYDYLIQDSQIDREQLDEIVDLMLETVCTSRKTIRVAGDDYPAELVKSKYMKLNGSPSLPDARQTTHARGIGRTRQTPRLPPFRSGRSTRALPPRTIRRLSARRRKSFFPRQRICALFKVVSF